MAKLIYRCKYFQRESEQHRSNYIKYLGTREGVELDPAQMPKAFWDDLDMHGKKSNHMDYIASRPGAVREAQQGHGLFSNTDTEICLEQVMEEVAQHKGRVWINVVSLKREDAERLGYDRLNDWKNLMRRHVADMAENYQIPLANLCWYGAFHNEGHHPHIHLVVYSRDPSQGFIQKKGIERMKSVLMNDVFKDDLYYLYVEKTRQREEVKEQSRRSLLSGIERLKDACSTDPVLAEKMTALAGRLSRLKGKKKYGYLHANLKQKIDEIVDLLAEIPEVKEVYARWMDYQTKITLYYQDEPGRILPLSQNKEFKSIKNMVIEEALQMAGGEESDTGGNNSGGSDRKDDAGRMQDVTTAVARLLYQLEKLLQEKLKHTDSRWKPVTDGKTAASDRARKIAQGQKEDDSESQENKKYQKM